MGWTVGIHVNLCGVDAAKELEKLRDIAADMGFIVTRGRNLGKGNAGELLLAITSGTVRVVKDSDLKP